MSGVFHRCPLGLVCSVQDLCFLADFDLVLSIIESGVLKTLIVIELFLLSLLLLSNVFLDPVRYAFIIVRFP